MIYVSSQINIGCGAEATAKYPVSLEYSTDEGLTWSLVGPSCVGVSGAACYDHAHSHSVYYAGDSLYWRRIVVPLGHLHICGYMIF